MNSNDGLQCCHGYIRIVRVYRILFRFSYLHVGMVGVGEDALWMGIGGGSWGRYRGRHAPEVAGLCRCWWQYRVSGGGAGLHHAHTHWSTLKLRANHRYQMLHSTQGSSGWLVSRLLISLEFHWDRRCYLVSAVILLRECDVWLSLQTHLDPPLFRTELVAVSCSVCTVRAPAPVRAVSALSPGPASAVTHRCPSLLTGLRCSVVTRCSLSWK